MMQVINVPKSSRDTGHDIIHGIPTFIMKRQHISTAVENPIFTPEVPRIIQNVLEIHMQMLVISEVWLILPVSNIIP